MVVYGGLVVVQAAKRAVSPIEHLAQVVNKLDPERPNPDDLAPQQFGVPRTARLRSWRAR